MKTVSSILGQLDLVHSDGRFPDPDHGYSYAVDARMHLFADLERWAWVVELVGYNPRAANLVDVMHVFGNCLTDGEPGFTNGDFLSRVDNMDDVGDGETYRGTAPVVVRGRPIPVEAPPGTRLEDVFRSLVPEFRDLLLADEAEVRARIPADIPLVLRLEEWAHPTDMWEGHAPSSYIVFRELARVLDSGDPSHYRLTAAPTTHWSNWPDSGSL